MTEKVQEEMYKATTQPQLGLTVGQLHKLNELEEVPQALREELEHWLEVHTNDEDEELYDDALDEPMALSGPDNGVKDPAKEAVTTDHTPENETAMQFTVKFKAALSAKKRHF